MQTESEPSRLAGETGIYSGKGNIYSLIHSFSFFMCQIFNEGLPCTQECQEYKRKQKISFLDSVHHLEKKKDLKWTNTVLFNKCHVRRSLWYWGWYKRGCTQVEGVKHDSCGENYNQKTVTRMLILFIAWAWEHKHIGHGWNSYEIVLIWENCNLVSKRESYTRTQNSYHWP